jgi:two-component system response regulator DevR
LAHIGVFLLDDHEDVRSILRRLINGADDLAVVAESGTVFGSLDLVLSTRPEVAVLDVRLPDGSGIEVGRDIRVHLAGTYCLMLTGSMDDEALMATVAAGAAGYILKPTNAATLQGTIRQAAMGQTAVGPGVAARVMERLRHRADERVTELQGDERRVLDLLADGLMNDEIADELGLTESAVRDHVSKVVAALDIR